MTPVPAAMSSCILSVRISRLHRRRQPARLDITREGWRPTSRVSCCRLQACRKSHMIRQAQDALAQAQRQRGQASKLVLRHLRRHHPGCSVVQVARCLHPLLGDASILRGSFKSRQRGRQKRCRPPRRPNITSRHSREAGRRRQAGGSRQARGSCQAWGHPHGHHICWERQSRWRRQQARSRQNTRQRMNLVEVSLAVDLVAQHNLHGRVVGAGRAAEAVEQLGPR